MKRGDFAQVIEVATSQLTVHSKQTDFSPMMSKKKWSVFVAGIAKEGILQPLVVTKGFRVIDGKHRLKAAKELGIEGIRVIVEDIAEDEIPNYIAETKLSRDDLSKGQRACIVLNLYEECEAAQAKSRMLLGKTLTPNGDRVEKGSKQNILAKKAGIGGGSMARLMEVRRKRPDLYRLVFDGAYSIGKSHAQMKADESPEELPSEPAESTIEKVKEVIEESDRVASLIPQSDEDEKGVSNVYTVGGLRKVTIINEAGLYSAILRSQNKKAPYYWSPSFLISNKSSILQSNAVHIFSKVSNFIPSVSSLYNFVIPFLCNPVRLATSLILSFLSPIMRDKCTLIIGIPPNNLIICFNVKNINISVDFAHCSVYYVINTTVHKKHTIVYINEEELKMIIERKKVQRKMVTVIFRYEGVTYPSDIVDGVLLENGKVLVSHEGISIYDAEILPVDGFVLVDLDVNSRDYADGDSKLILEMVAGGGLTC